MSLEVIVSKEMKITHRTFYRRGQLYIDAFKAMELTISELNLGCQLATGGSIGNTEILLKAWMGYFENAADSIKMRVEEDDNFVGELKLLLQLHADTVRLEVEDNGTGIAPEVEPQLFVRQLESAKVGRLNMYGGLGIFLCSLKVTIEKASGKVWYVNRGKDVGAVFWCEVPLAYKS